MPEATQKEISESGLIDLLNHMFANDPNERWSLEDIIKNKDSKWYNSPNVFTKQ